jgi:hypothetical protein
MAIFQLLYRSQSRGEASRNQIQQILESSVRNNGRRDITELLLYNGRTFLQLLEGEEGAVRRCYEKICLDSRHTAPFVLAQVNSERRLFPAWKMGGVEMKPDVALNDLSYVLQVTASHGAYDETLVLKILREFASTPLPPAGA